MSVRFITISEAHEGQRIDNFLLNELKGVPKSAVYRILRKGEVRANKKRVKPDYRLLAGDEIRIPPIRTAERDPVSPHQGVLDLIESSILYEDDALLVLNKPSGVAVHGGSGLSYGVIEALRASRGSDGFLELVHRLDRETSGCLMVAKKRAMLVRLHDKLQQGDMDKRYQALLVGRWHGKKHVVEAPLEKTQQGGERIIRVGREGKAARTEFRLLEHLPRATWVEASPITGRTHQIRVHAQFAGHPLAGDDKYTTREQNEPFRRLGLKRLFLHAHRLVVPAIRDGVTLDVSAPLPPELGAVLDQLRSLGVNDGARYE